MTQTSRVSEFVTDTIGLVLFLERRRTGEIARRIFAEVEQDRAKVHIPAMVLAEIMYLSERGRIVASVSHVTQLLEQSDSFQELPITLATIQSAAEINDIPELHDRIIAGAARSQGLPLITNDLQITRSSYITTIW